MKTITFSIKNKLILYLLFAVCAFSSVIVFSSRSYATIATDEVRFINSGQAWFSLLANNTGMDCTAGCTTAKNSNADEGIGLNQVELSIPAGTYYSDTIFRYDIMLWKVSNNTSVHANMNNYTLGNSYINIYDVEAENIDSNNSVIHFYFKFNQTFTIQSDRVLLRGNAAANSFVFYLNPQERISAGYWSQWAIVDTSVDTTSIVNAINSHDYTSSLNTINSGISSVNNNLNQVNNSINQSNQDAEDRYQDEKDTIEQNGEDAQDTGESIGFDFSLINPFGNLFSSFNDSCTARIPNIGDWINLPAEQRVVNSWWCKSAKTRTVRYNLGLIFSAFSSVIMFGIIWKWFIKPKGDSG